MSLKLPFLLGLGAMAYSAVAQAALLASLGPQGLQWQSLATSDARALQLSQVESGVALGSVWKVFVYIYLQQQKIADSAFTCTRQGAKREDEEYCCEPGQSVGRELALARSCGPYFEPERWRISGPAWRQFWQQHLPGAPRWLLDVQQMQPATPVKPAELLQTIQTLPASSRESLRLALLSSSLQGTAQVALAALGSAPRLKTFTWQHPQHKGMRIGGALGLMPNGRAFWLAANGSSRQVLQEYAGQLAPKLEQLRQQPDTGLAASFAAEPCVEVAFFTRYPLQQVLSLDGKPDQAAGGNMHGRYRILFKNGNTLQIQASPEMQLQTTPHLQIRGRFALNDYVARVVEREGNAEAGAAARALALAARSYLLQNGVQHGACYQIADDSRSQRVSPNRPSSAALAAAWFSDGLSLTGVNVRYHQELAGPDMMSWQQAVQQAREGWDMQAILHAAYPQAHLRALSGQEDCQRLASSEVWLTQAAKLWHRQLRQEVGYEIPPQPVMVCALDYGNPYSDQRRLRVYVRPQLGIQERLSLAHEYLHLAFRHHPRGMDERFIEGLARKLVDGPSVARSMNGVQP